MKIFLSLFILFCGLSNTSRAEYRMFTLKITNTQTQDFRLVDSTLDPIQYPYYYPVRPNEIVQYTDTWRCYGRTGGETPPCQNPKAAPPVAPPSDSGQNQGPAPSANP